MKNVTKVKRPVRLTLEEKIVLLRRMRERRRKVRR